MVLCELRALWGPGKEEGGKARRERERDRGAEGGGRKLSEKSDEGIEWNTEVVERGRCHYHGEEIEEAAEFS